MDLHLFDSIRMVLVAFAGTNHVSIGPWLGREQHGAPQGDALSSALLRLWKWHQEYHRKIARTAESTPILESKCKLLFLVDCSVLVLDVSYRDDLRMFFAWRASSDITPNLVHAWAWSHWRRRFEVGTMSLEEADGNAFTGLQISWNAAAITLQPRMPDVWAAYCYDEVDNFPLKSWQSWGPPNQVFCADPGIFVMHAVLFQQHYGKCLRRWFLGPTMTGTLRNGWLLIGP